MPRISINTLQKTSFEQSDLLLEKFKTSDVLIKSIRWDKKNFLLSFLDGITPIKDQPRNKQPLRLGGHKPWTVYGTGFYKRSEKPSPYPYSAEKIIAKKEKRSQPQSTTLIKPKVQPPVFGHQANRRDKLAGYMFLAEDALMNRWFKYDTGTINRPYEHYTKKSAKKYYKKKVLTNDPVLFESFEEFKKAISQQDNKLNEVLARIRWKDGKSCVAVYSDTFEARCIAQYYAESLKYRLKIKAKTEGVTWDDNIDIPIFNYLPGNSKHWTRYTAEEQAKDRKKANAIINDENKLNAAMTKSDLEFLLLAEDPLSILKQPVISGDRCLLEHVAKEDKLCHLLLSLMHRAVLKNAKKTSSFLHAYPDIAKTILTQAASIGYVDFVKALLTHPNIKMNAQNKSGYNPLLWAAYNGYTDCVKALLARPDIDVNVKDNNGSSLLMWAAEKGHRDFVKALLTHPNIDVNAQNKHGYNALMNAALSGHVGCVKALLTHPDININAQAIDGNNALIFAAYRGHADCVKALLARLDIDVNVKAKDCKSALMLAAQYGHTDCVKALLAHPDIYVNAQDKDGKSALMLAAQNGHTDCVKALLPQVILDYLKSLSARESEFEPRVPLFASLFRANGYSKTAKMQAAMKVLSLLNNTHQDTVLTEEDIAALKNGKLGGIVKYLPDQDRVRIGLS